MKLRELLVDAEVAEIVGDAEVEIAGLSYDSRTVEPGTLFFCVPGQRSDGHEFGAARRGARRHRARRRAAPGRRGDPGAGRRRPRGDGPDRGSLLGRSHREAARGRRHRHQREDDHRLPDPARPGVAGDSDRAPGHGEADRRRRRGGGGADHARGDRPPADVPPHARGGRCGLRDGGLLARPGAGAQRRRPLRGRRVHQPDPGPPRLPRRHGGVLPGQARAVHLLARPPRRRW